MKGKLWNKTHQHAHVFLAQTCSFKQGMWLDLKTTATDFEVDIRIARPGVRYLAGIGKLGISDSRKPTPVNQQIPKPKLHTNPLARNIQPKRNIDF